MGGAGSSEQPDNVVVLGRVVRRPTTSHCAGATRLVAEVVHDHDGRGPPQLFTYEPQHLRLARALAEQMMAGCAAGSSPRWFSPCSGGDPGGRLLFEMPPRSPAQRCFVVLEPDPAVALYSIVPGGYDEDGGDDYDADEIAAHWAAYMRTLRARLPTEWQWLEAALRGGDNASEEEPRPRRPRPCQAADMPSAGRSALCRSTLSPTDVPAICTICLDKPATVVYLPCRHRVVCESCLEEQAARPEAFHRVCPSCRGAIECFVSDCPGAAEYENTP